MYPVSAGEVEKKATPLTTAFFYATFSYRRAKSKRYPYFSLLRSSESERWGLLHEPVQVGKLAETANQSCAWVCVCTRAFPLLARDGFLYGSQITFVIVGRELYLWGGIIKAMKLIPLRHPDKPGDASGHRVV